MASTSSPRHWLRWAVVPVLVAGVAVATWVQAAPAPSTKLKPPPAILRPSPGEAVLIGAGDIAQCGSDIDERTGVLVQRMLAASKNAQAFTAGDNAYPDGTTDQYRRCYEPSWGMFKGRTLPAAGNHDWRTPNAAGMRATFAGRFSQDGPLYYAADVDGVDEKGAKVHWRVVVLDSDCDKVDCTEQGAQYAWLKDEIRRQGLTKTLCSAVIFHHPRFSSGPHGDAETMKPLWRLLDDAGTDLVISGHDHIYERFPPLDADGGAGTAGMPSIVVGTGGKSHYPAVFAREHSLLRDTDHYGVLALRLGQKGWTSGFWTVDDEVRDLHKGTCR